MADELEIPDGEGLEESAEGLEVELGEELPSPEPVETPEAVEVDPLDAKLEAARAAGEDVLEAYLASLEKQVEDEEKPEEEEEDDDDDLTPEQIDASEFVRYKTVHADNEMKARETIENLAAVYRDKYNEAARIADEVGADTAAHRAAKENALAIHAQIKAAENEWKAQQRANGILEYAERVAAAIPQIAGVKAQYAKALFQGHLDINQPVAEHLKLMRQAGWVKSAAKPPAPKLDKARLDKIKAKLGSKKNTPSTAPSAPRTAKANTIRTTPDEYQILVERGLIRPTAKKAGR